MVEHQLIDDTIKGIFREQAKFVDEVIDSEAMDDKVCRFGCLQQASICKLMMQCGTTAEEFGELVKKGLRYTGEIAKESKASKYIGKQLEYWQRLEQGDITIVESFLKTRGRGE